jgi:hypothetical protein
METAIPPKLKPGEKIHYPIFHDECCVHANDQCSYVWMREGEQPLRDKSRGRIVHISDFIIEHSGRLVLWEFLREEQLKLPKQPAPPAPAATSADAPDATALTSAAPTPVPSSTSGSTSAAKGKGRGSRRKAPAQPKPKPADCRTLDQTNTWIPPPPPAPFTSYQLPSFDARQIIYPGANHDPWWDMPQLIAQVDT